MHAKIALLGILAGVLSAIVGAWTVALESLAILMVLDYATGLILAGVFHASPKSKGGTLESRAALKGLLRKGGIIIIVVALHQADRLTGKAFLRDGAAFAFCVEEIISLIENLGAMGVPMPGFISKAIEWLHGKSDNLTAMIPDTQTDKPPDQSLPLEGTGGVPWQKVPPQGADEVASQEQSGPDTTEEVASE